MTLRSANVYLSRVFARRAAAYDVSSEAPSGFLFNVADEGQLEPIPSEWPRPEGVCFWGADYGARGKKLAIVRYGAFDKERPIDLDKFINLDFAEPGDYVVIESAHLVARNTRVSLSQPATFEQLKTLKENAKRKNIIIKEWPQSQTYKYRNTVFGQDSEKTDHNDACAIIYGALHLGIDNLKTFKAKPSSARTDDQQWCYNQIKEMNELLNLYRIYHSYEHSNCLILFEKCKMSFENVLWDLSGQNGDAYRWFAGDNLKDNSKTSATLSLWVSLVAWDGSARRYNQRDIGINKVMRDLLLFKPMHHRGGVARSNLMYWKFKKICNELNVPKDVKRKHDSTDYQNFQNAKRRFRKAVKIALKALRVAHQQKAGDSVT